MGWGRIDDGLHLHRKWVCVSWASRGVWTTIFSWCCAQSNGGKFTLADVTYLTGEDLSVAISELRFKGWIDEDVAPDGSISYQLHDFLFWNPGANQVAEAEAAEARSRKAAAAGRKGQEGKSGKVAGCRDCDRKPRACYGHSNKKKKRDLERNAQGTLSPTPVLRLSYASPTPLRDTSPKSAIHKGEATYSPSHPTPSNQQTSAKPSNPGSQTNLMLEGLWDAWREKRPRHLENLATFKATWNQSAVDLDAFTQAVSWRLDRFDTDDPDTRQDYLGTLSNFLTSGRWQQELAPLPQTKGQTPTSHDREEFTLPPEGV